MIETKIFPSVAEFWKHAPIPYPRFPQHDAHVMAYRPRIRAYGTLEAYRQSRKAVADKLRFAEQFCGR